MAGKTKKKRHIVIIIVLLVLVIAEAFVLIRTLMKNDTGAGFDVVTEPQGQNNTSITNEEQSLIPRNKIINGKLLLYYDDRFSFDSAVDEMETITVVSRRTGTEQDDESVLRLDNRDPNKIIAVGCGTARVTLEGGRKIEVSVDKAPISLFLIAGQSNGEGRIAENRRIETVSKQYVLNEEGTAYSTYGFSDNKISEEITWYSDITDDMSIYNYITFLPESLTENDNNSIFAKTNCLTDAEGAVGKGGIDSAFAYRWHQLTNEKVWLINACAHGSSIDTWQSKGEPQDNNFWQAVYLYQGAERILSEEIEAGHYILRHKGILWYQGEADRDMRADDYYEKLSATYRDFRKELGAEFMGLFMVRSTIRGEDPAADFRMTGPRTVLYYVSADKTNEGMFLASHIDELWTDNESVKAYFIRKYGSEEGFNNAYPVLAEKMPMPDVTKDILGSVHFTQIAYNEMGFDAAENICCHLGYCNTEDDPEIVKVVMEEGITDVAGSAITIPVGESVPFAVKVFPASLEKETIITTSPNISVSPSGLTIEDERSGYIKISVGRYNTQINVNK